MSRSLSLATYLALRRSGNAPATGPAEAAPDRPSGSLIWVHSPDPARIASIGALCGHMTAEGDRVRFLVTTDGPATAAQPLIVQPCPPDMRDAARGFLAHWRPDLLIWMQGYLHPALLAEADDTGLPRILVDATADQIGLAGLSWLPGVTRALLGRFDRALAVDAAAAQRLRKAGMDPGRIEVTGPLDAAPPVLSCSERDRRDLAQTIGTRPVWLAAGVPLQEVGAIIAAQRIASRRTHRLLLILAPQYATDAAAIASRLRAAGLNVTSRGDGDEPGETTEVYLTEDMAEMGLWYRLAPMTYLGGTLSGTASGHAGRHPFEAAALGSAVLHGPVIDDFAEPFRDLTGAGASRPVRSGADLGNAIEALLAPDRAAALAHAAWDVTTAGATVSNRVIALIRDRLDRGGA